MTGRPGNPKNEDGVRWYEGMGANLADHHVAQGEPLPPVEKPQFSDAEVLRRVRKLRPDLLSETPGQTGRSK